MMKKLISLLLSLLMMSSFMYVLAVEPSEVQTDEVDVLSQYYEAKGYVEVVRPSTPEEVKAQLTVDSRTSELAYMDLDSASKDMKDDILAARREIIYSTSWYVDNGFIGSPVRINPEKGEWSRTPKFSELFPGWDVPTESIVSDTEAIRKDAIEILTDNYISPRDILFNGNASVRKASSSTLTSPFKTWVPSETYRITETLKSLVTSTNCNLGVTNMSVSPYKSMYYEENLTAGHILVFDVFGNGSRKAGFRVSTYGTPGTAGISITY